MAVSVLPDDSLNITPLLTRESHSQVKKPLLSSFPESIRHNTHTYKPSRLSIPPSYDHDNRAVYFSTVSAAPVQCVGLDL